SVFLFWARRGVTIFRVDNPHTKPFPFWQWVIGEVRAQYPDALFLAEAFTRPKVMHRLAKAGFNQSYTYFTWRDTKQELTDYMTELTRTGQAEYFRPNFWPNTPDILSEVFQRGGRPVFLSRLVLAATLSSNYGLYGPAYEQCVNEAVPGKEEYLNSEKYEIKEWNLNAPGSLRPLIKKLNAARRGNAALQSTNNIRFLETENQNLIAYVKASRDGSSVIITAVNLDCRNRQSGWVHLPLSELGLPNESPYKVHDLLTGQSYVWSGGRNYVELDPALPAHLLKLEGHLHREQDFDFYA
ncbi:MAG: alpha-1,4-glucan--maltose-1-phosphate maltosyltransferase, partial [Elusimicrobia bacterium CG_4_10_14_0_2_um_filter_56_8]